MAITIGGPVKIFTVFERGNWNLKWTVSNMELQFSYARNPTDFEFFFTLNNRKQAKMLNNNFQADTERFY